MSKKVLIGMSGGVDSSVAASMLIEQGYEVHGVFVEAYNEPGCRTDQDKKDALQVALKLGIKFTVLDLRKEYKERVVNYFIDEYSRGRTPNPDIVCNRDIKFGLLYEYMEKNGYDYLATGHYARVSVRHELLQPKDLNKDQTYFLWQVAREKLGRVLFPLGNMYKKEVREKAKMLDLPNAHKPDSMGVCMLGELNVREFLTQKLGTNPGEVWWENKLVGTHLGLWFYTIGGKGGWKVKPEAQSASMPPLYVTAKNLKLNTLEVGVREKCYSQSFEVSEVVGEVRSNRNIWVRVRNLGELTAVTQLNGDTVTLEQPIFALAPGQSAVFYDESGCVVGGGIIA